MQSKLYIELPQRLEKIIDIELYDISILVDDCGIYGEVEPQKVKYIDKEDNVFEKVLNVILVKTVCFSAVNYVLLDFFNSLEKEVFYYSEYSELEYHKKGVLESKEKMLYKRRMRNSLVFNKSQRRPHQINFTGDPNLGGILTIKEVEENMKFLFEQRIIGADSED